MLDRITRARYVIIDADGRLPVELRSRREAIRTARSIARTSPRDRLIRVIREARGRTSREVWCVWGCDGGDEEDALVPRRPRPHMGSGAIALPLPDA
jgi:hypothetical protein